MQNSTPMVAHFRQHFEGAWRCRRYAPERAAYRAVEMKVLFGLMKIGVGVPGGAMVSTLPGFLHQQTWQTSESWVYAALDLHQSVPCRPLRDRRGHSIGRNDRCDHEGYLAEWIPQWRACCCNLAAPYRLWNHDDGHDRV